jgi:hypothetical protein
MVGEDLGAADEVVIAAANAAVAAEAAAAGITVHDAIDIESHGEQTQGHNTYTLFMGRTKIMLDRNTTSDKELLKSVNRRLERSGMGRARVAATVQRGIVTISGLLQFENQRRPLTQAVRSIAGVRSIVDQLRLAPKHG